MRTSTSLLLLSALLIASCKKDDDPPPANSGGGGTNTGGEGTVYVCGSIDISGEPYVRYWKNGQEMELNSSGRPSSARAIWADGTHVIAAGKVREQGSVNYQPCYWVDDELFELDNEAGSSFCSVEDLFVANGDELHMVGHIRASSGFNKAMYWGPGSSTALTDGSTDAEARGVCLAGGAVYVCGYVTDQAFGGEKIATYWLNGSPVTLGDGYGDSEANDIRVVNGDVIVVGMECVYIPALDDCLEQAVVWVNGVRDMLTVNGGAAHALHIDGSNIHVGGMANSGVGSELPNRWVNGDPYSLGSLDDTIIDLFVRNGIVHSVTGDLYINHSTDTYSSYGGMYGIHIH
jgi:hypothetical protein